MNFANDESILLRHFQDTFVAQYPNIPADYAGQKNDPLDHRIATFRVKRATSRQTAMAGRRYMRNFGSVLVFLSTPTNEGPGEILEMADFISKSYLGFRSGGLLCRAPSLTGPWEKGAFLEATVDVPFTSDYHADTH